MNIANAIQEEQRYLNDRLNGIDTSLIQRLSQYGYRTLDEYFNDKRDHLLASLDYDAFFGDGKPALNMAISSLIAQKPYFTIATMPKTTIVHGADGGINYDVCEELDIEIIESHSPGGTIICSPGDQQHAIVVPTAIDVTPRYFLNRLARFCKKYYENVVVDNNDILIDGKKVVPSSTAIQDGMMMFIFQMSFTDSSDLVARICTKNGPKPVGYVTKFTAEELANEVKSWLLEQ